MEKQKNAVGRRKEAVEPANARLPAEYSSAATNLGLAPREAASRAAGRWGWSGCQGPARAAAESSPASTVPRFPSTGRSTSTAPDRRG